MTTYADPGKSGDAQLQDAAPYDKQKSDERKESDQPEKNLDINVFLPKKKRNDDMLPIQYPSSYLPMQGGGNLAMQGGGGGNLAMPMINELSRALEREQMGQEMSHMSHAISQTMVDALLIAGRHGYHDHDHHFHDHDWHDHDWHDHHDHGLTLHDLEYAFDHFPHHHGVGEDDIAHALKAAFQSVIKEVREKNKDSDKQTLVQAVPDLQTSPETQVIEAPAPPPPTPPPAIIEAASPAPTQSAVRVVSAAAEPPPRPPPPPPAVVAAPPPPAPPPPPPPPTVVAAPPAPPPPPPPPTIVAAPPAPPPPPPPPTVIEAPPPPPPPPQPIVAAPPAPPPPIQTVAAQAPIAAAPPPPITTAAAAPIATAPAAPIATAPSLPAAALPQAPIAAAHPPHIGAFPQAPIAAASQAPIYAGAKPGEAISSNPALSALTAPSSAALPQNAATAPPQNSASATPGESPPATQTSQPVANSNSQSQASNQGATASPSPGSESGTSKSEALKDFADGKQTGNSGYKILGDILARAMLKAEKKLDRTIQGAVVAEDGENDIQRHIGGSNGEEMVDYQTGHDEGDYPDTERELHNGHQQWKDNDASYESSNEPKLHQESQAQYGIKEHYTKRKHGRHFLGDMGENKYRGKYKDVVQGHYNKKMASNAKTRRKGGRNGTDISLKLDNNDPIGEDNTKHREKAQFSDLMEEELYEDNKRNVGNEHKLSGQKGRKHGKEKNSRAIQ